MSNIDEGGEFTLATCISAVSSGKVSLKFPGETSGAALKKYAVLNTSGVGNGVRVLCARISGTWVVLGAFGASGGGGGGTSDYTDLENKPSINNVTLDGNKTASQLGLGTYSLPSGGIPLTDLAAAVQSALLPAVTASDNDKVLMVVDGAWAAASIPNASGVSF